MTTRRAGNGNGKGNGKDNDKGNGKDNGNVGWILGWAGEDGRALRDTPPCGQKRREDGAPGFVASITGAWCG